MINNHECRAGKTCREKGTSREKELEEVIQDIFWMARRYAHGRHTYAPSIVRQAYMKCIELNVRIAKDKTIEPPAEFKEGTMFFRSDYLDDIN